MKDRRINNKDFVPTNYQIRSLKVRCIGLNNENLGVIDKNEAIKIAEGYSLDLIQVCPGDPPTCKILDYGKYKYEMSKKQKENAKKQRESFTEIKEIKLHPNTSENDIKIKAQKAEELLSDGSRVKLSVVFRGREITHKDVGLNTLKDLVNLIPNIQLYGEPVLQGKVLSVLSSKKKEIKAAS